MRAAILLAAGASRRFGGRDKLKARIGKHSLLDLVLAHARAAGPCRIIVVSAGRIRLAGVTHVHAHHARKGLSASLAAGLAALRPIEREVLIFLARQTLITSARPGMAIWREKLFAWMLRNAESAMEFFRLPTNRVVEVGSQVEI